MTRRMAREPAADADPTTQPTPARESKIDKVLALLRRDQGASLDELVKSTGWLPHTTRAALTGLRKKGHAIDKQKVEGVTRYAIAPTPAPAAAQ